MALIDWLQPQQPEVEKKYTAMGIDFEPFQNIFAGVTVTEEQAKRLDTVYACVRDKAESVGQLPAVIKRNGKQVFEGREYDIFGQRPNEFQTLQDFIEMYVACMEFNGAFYAYPVRNEFGNVREIIPFFNQRAVSPVKDANGNIFYQAVLNDGGKPIIFKPKELMVIKMFTTDGYTPLSAVRYNARTIGVSIAQEDFLSELMQNGALSKGILTTQQVFTDDKVIDRMRKQWKERFGGVRNSGETPILEQGLEYKNTGLSPADTQLIMQRKYSREQICGLFRVPPHRIGASEKQTYNNVEQNNIAYLRDSLIPLITKFEFAMSELMRGNFTFKLNVAEFTRGDRKSQVESVAEIWKLSLCSRGEARAALDYEDVDETPVWVVDSNNLTLGTLDDLKKIQQARLNEVNNEPSEPEIENEAEGDNE